MRACNEEHGVVKMMVMVMMMILQMFSTADSSGLVQSLHVEFQV